MLKAAIKFCGGCNPRYDRGQAYNKIRQLFQDKIEFFLPQDGEKYDILLVISGCTACNYQYEEIDATHRVYLALAEQFDDTVKKLDSLYSTYSKK